MPRLAPFFLALFLAAPAVAQQTCATAADLADGIAVTYANGGMDIFTADPTSPGTVIWQGEYEGMPLGTSRLGQGFIFLSATSATGLEVRYDYGILPGDLPRPTPGGRWEGVATVSANGADATERQIHRYGGAATLTLGLCTYPMIPVVIEYPAHQEDLFWFSELGISVRAREVVTMITPLAMVP